MADITIASQTRLDRRQLLRRGALVGGAVWAAPVITSVRIPLASAGTPLGHDISNISFAFTCDGEENVFVVKWDPEDDDPCTDLAAHPKSEPGERPDHCGQLFVEQATGGGCAVPLRFDVDDRGTTWILTLDEHCEFVSGASFCANKCHEVTPDRVSTSPDGTTRVVFEPCPFDAPEGAEVLSEEEFEQMQGEQQELSGDEHHEFEGGDELESDDTTTSSSSTSSSTSSTVVDDD